jgi:uncharacterized protein (TIGR00369 family)
VITDRQPTLARHRHAQHRRCLLCGPAHPLGLGLEFKARPGGQVEARLSCRRLFQGYGGQVHGGVIAAVLDSAMTNCLFAHDIVAVTGDLNVRYLHPVKLARTAVVRASIAASAPPLHRMESELVQEGRLVARATARFMEREISGLPGKAAGRIIGPEGR